MKQMFLTLTMSLVISSLTYAADKVNAQKKCIGNIQQLTRINLRIGQVQNQKYVLQNGANDIFSLNGALFSKSREAKISQLSQVENQLIAQRRNLVWDTTSFLNRQPETEYLKGFDLKLDMLSFLQVGKGRVQDALASNDLTKYFQYRKTVEEQGMSENELAQSMKDSVQSSDRSTEIMLRYCYLLPQ